MLLQLIYGNKRECYARQITDIVVARNDFRLRTERHLIVIIDGRELLIGRLQHSFTYIVYLKTTTCYIPAHLTTLYDYTVMSGL